LVPSELLLHFQLHLYFLRWVKLLLNQYGLAIGLLLKCLMLKLPKLKKLKLTDLQRQ